MLIATATATSTKQITVGFILITRIVTGSVIVLILILIGRRSIGVSEQVIMVLSVIVVVIGRRSIVVVVIVVVVI